MQREGLKPHSPKHTSRMLFLSRSPLEDRQKRHAVDIEQRVAKAAVDYCKESNTSPSALKKERLPTSSPKTYALWTSEDASKEYSIYNKKEEWVLLFRIMKDCFSMECEKRYPPPNALNSNNNALVPEAEAQAPTVAETNPSANSLVVCGLDNDLDPVAESGNSGQASTMTSERAITENTGSAGSETTTTLTPGDCVHLTTGTIWSRPPGWKGRAVSRAAGSLKSDGGLTEEMVRFLKQPNGEINAVAHERPLWIIAFAMTNLCRALRQEGQDTDNFEATEKALAIEKAFKWMTGLTMKQCVDGRKGPSVSCKWCTAQHGLVDRDESLSSLLG